MPFPKNKKILQIITKLILVPAIISFASFTFLQNDLGNNVNSSSAFQAINYWSIGRTYPADNISSQALIKAKEYSSKNLKNRLNKITEPDPWKPIGPNNIGGRTLSIAVNPKNPETIYAGSAGGGLWRSYTGGIGASAWKYIATGFPVLAVSSIAIDPVDTNKIYIGTGEVYNLAQTGTSYADRLTIGSYGIGILKTSDGGATWEQSLNWKDSLQVGVNAIKITPGLANIIWAATTVGTYKNTNYGDSTKWVRVYGVEMATDLIISPANPNRVLVACGNLSSSKNGLYKTENGGESWKLLPGFPVVPFSFLLGKMRVDVSESSPSIMFSTLAYGDYKKNYNTTTWTNKSTNSGDLWLFTSQSNWASYNGWYSHDVAVNPQNPDEIITGGVNVWKSTNGGSTFTQISDDNAAVGEVEPGTDEGTSQRYVHQNIHEIVYNPVKPDIIYFATDGGVFRTTDGGNTFEGCNGGYQTTNFNQGFSVSQQDKDFIIAGAQSNGTNIYNGSSAWKRFILPNDGGVTGISSLDDNIIYASHQNLNVFKSNNKGLTFSHLNIPDLANPTSYMAPFIVGNKNPDIMYTGRDKIYQSVDGGSSWFVSNKGEILDGNPVVKMAIDPQNSEVVYAATFPLEQKDAGIEAGLFRKASDDNTWVEISNGLPDRFIGSIYVDNKSFVYVTILGFGTSHLFRSTNLGQSWTDIGKGLPDVPASAVIVDPDSSTNIYVGNDLGVYYSPNSGTTWQSFSNGLPDAVMVTDLKINKNERLLRVSTNGSGFFERKLATENPTRINEEILPSDFKLYQNYPNPFNPTTVISFTIPVELDAKFASTIINIYDILGNRISTLINKELNPGNYKVEFNASGLASGVYYYRLEIGNYSLTKKMLLLK